MPDSSLLVQILLAIVGAGTIGSIITAIMSRKKLGADATQAITAAASGVVGDFEKLLDRKDAEIKTLYERVEAMEARTTAAELVASHAADDMRRIRETLQIHAAWDWRVIRLLEECETVTERIPEAPPLIPAGLHAEGGYRPE